MSYKSINLKFISPILCLVIGCGTWLGNPKDPTKPTTTGNSEISLTFQGAATEQALSGLAIPVTGKSLTTIGSVTLTEARVVLGEIIIKPLASDKDDREIFQGPYVVDLLSNTTTPAPTNISLSAGEYSHIALKIRKIEPDQASGILNSSDELIGQSILLKGEYRDALTSQTKPFSMKFSLDEKFFLDRTNSINFASDTLNAVVIAFNLTQWFNFTGREYDFSDISSTSIVLDKTAEGSTSEVRNAIKENIKSSSSFGKDSDGNGKLEVEERG